MSAGYRPTPYTVPPPRRGSRLLHRDSALRRLDWTLLLSVLALCAIGGALVWSATRQEALDTGGDPTAFLEKHADRGWTSVESFRGLLRERVVAHSQIRRPDDKEYHGGREAEEPSHVIPRQSRGLRKKIR